MAGIDEVGRGSWAGPVSVGAVILPTDRRLYKLRDSKRLTAPAREHLAARIRASGAGIGIGHATAGEIDRLGLAAALRLAAHRAVDALPREPDTVLIDGTVDLLDGRAAHRELLIKGDDRSVSIAAASIVAKVTRDAMMVEAEQRFPGYGFAANKGYPSPAHRSALARLGPSPLHRHSWAPIVALTTPRLFDDG